MSQLPIVVDGCVEGAHPAYLSGIMGMGGTVGDNGHMLPNAFKPVVLNVGDDPYKGNLNAKLTIIDFSDYQ